MFIDKGLEFSSSTKMGGVINPITGRKFVKTWLIDELLPVALDTYHDFEVLLDEQLIYSKNIFRFFNDIEDENNWMARNMDPEYQQYFGLDFIAYEIMYLNHDDGFGVISNAFLIDIPLLVRKFRDYLIQRELIIEEIFNFDKLIVSENEIKYDGFVAENIIFAEGYSVIKNPYFHFIPMNLAKGEALKVRFKDMQFHNIMKKRITIEPLPDGLHWVGSNYIWDFEDSEPTDSSKRYFWNNFQRWLN
ncbi:MAG: hypothetical protein R2771_14455 [Saprospiraceae bacterium]